MSAAILKDNSLDDTKSLVEMLLKHDGFSELDCYTLGQKLGLSKASIAEIQSEYEGNNTKHLLECIIKTWLQQTGANSSRTFFALKNALVKMGNNKVADEIHKKRHPACVILSQYEEELKDVLLQFVMVLHAKGIVGVIILSSTPAENVQLLLDALRDSVCLNHHNLVWLAHVFQEEKNTASLGAAILQQYRGSYTETEGCWVACKDGGVDFHLRKSKITKPLTEIRETWKHTLNNASEAMKKIPPVKDLRRYLICSNPSLKAQLADCKTIGDILKVVTSKSSLSIAPIESIVNQFKIEAVKPIIDEYKRSVIKFFDDIPIQSYLHDCGGEFTLVIDSDIDSDAFDDIKCLLNAYASHFDLSINFFVVKETD